MTTFGSSKDISPEYMEIPTSVEVSMTQASMSLDSEASMISHICIDVPLTQICAKLLQPYQPPQICSELQAPSNNAAEDDWLVSILNHVDDTTDKPQIQGIPPLLRDKLSNKNCYDPLLVSIGPYHHKNPRLKAFEKLKIPIAQKFVHACGDQVSIKQLREEVEEVSETVRKWYKECFRACGDQSIKQLREDVEKVGESVRKWYKECSPEQSQKFIRACGDQVSIKQLCEEVEEVGESVRKWCEECSPEQCDKFNKMMFLDACFVLYFIIYLYPKPKDTDMQEKEADPLHRWRRYLVFVQRDLFLLENQIPLLLLKVLMKFLFKGERLDWETKLIQNFVDKKFIMPPPENPGNNDVKKFLAQMMGCIVQIKEKWKSDMDPHLLHPDREQLIEPSPEDKNQKEKLKSPPHLLHLVREQLIGPPKDKKKESVKWHSYRSVMELKSAGIHFRPSQTNHVTDVDFKSHLFSGTLTLPPIMVDDTTKPLLLNLVAYEMCLDDPSDYHIMSYICLMDSLIDHADDAKELRRRKILVNNLGSDEELAHLFNEIANGLVFDPSAYAGVKLKIKNHCESRTKVWMAEWIHDHFSSPWAFLAFLGAIFVIFLTAVQTYFAVFPH